MSTRDRPSVRQITPEERAQLDHDAEQVVAEVLGLPAAAATPIRGRLSAFAHRVGSAIAGTGRRVRAVLTRENFDIALERSAGFTRMVAKYGLEVARDEVMRRVRRDVEQKIGSLAGSVGGTEGGGAGCKMR